MEPVSPPSPLPAPLVQLDYAPPPPQAKRRFCAPVWVRITLSVGVIATFVPVGARINPSGALIDGLWMLLHGGRIAPFLSENMSVAACLAMAIPLFLLALAPPSQRRLQRGAAIMTLSCGVLAALPMGAMVVASISALGHMERSGLAVGLALFYSPLLTGLVLSIRATILRRDISRIAWTVAATPYLAMGCLVLWAIGRGVAGVGFGYGALDWGCCLTAANIVVVAIQLAWNEMGPKSTESADGDVN